MMITDKHNWKIYKTYLTEQTPVSEPQAEVLALRKAGRSTDEISEILTLPVDTVEDRLDEVLNQLDDAKEFCTIMKPHPGVDIETRQTTDIDDTLYHRLSSAVMYQPDEERSKIELELYHRLTATAGESFLLIEREVTEPIYWATKTTEERSAHKRDALRGYIYTDAETLDEYYLRYALLEKANIDPTGNGAPTADAVLDQNISQSKAELARVRVLDQATQHSATDFIHYH